MPLEGRASRKRGRSGGGATVYSWGDEPSYGLVEGDEVFVKVKLEVDRVYSDHLVRHRVSSVEPHHFFAGSYRVGGGRSFVRSLAPKLNPPPPPPTPHRPLHRELDTH